jgi:type VI secretion system protein ImpA
MHTPDILDFAALLHAIDGERPSGEDLRRDTTPTSIYYQIKDARAAARAAERAGSQPDQGQMTAPEWQAVLRLAPGVLAKKSKDLEIVAWLIEALVRTHGFAGLRDGFRLARELVDTYWEGLYPQPDEDGIATRVAPLAGLNGGESEGTLAVPIALAPFTADGDQGPFSLWRYAKVREVAKMADPAAQKQAVDNGAATMEQFQATVRKTDPDLFRRLISDLDATVEHYTKLTALLDAKCGPDSPPSSAIANMLTDARQTILHVARDIAGISIDAEAPPAAEAAGKTDGRHAAAGTGLDDLSSREDAFRVLGRVADYFREREPHSPIPSLLDQAVRWGRLPLSQLIDELIPDATARDHFGLVTGLRGRPAPASDG